MYGITVHNVRCEDQMDLIRFRHRGLERLYEGKNAKGIPAGMRGKLRKLLFALETASSLQS